MLSTKHLLCGSIILGCVSFGPPASAQTWNDVLPQVKQRCAREFPDDYSTQAYCIKQQHEGWVAVNGGESDQNAAPPANNSSDITARPAPAAASDDQSEADLISTVVHYKDLYNSASNDMVKGGLRPERGHAICKIAQLQVRNWHGNVYSLSSNNDGNGVIEIELGQGVYVETMNNSLSDMEYNTLIPHGTPLFNDVAALHTGQSIEFSGALFSDPVDCFHENSLTVDGAMTEPEFLIRLTSVKHEDVPASVTPPTPAPMASPVPVTAPASTPLPVTPPAPATSTAFVPPVRPNGMDATHAEAAALATETPAFNDGRAARIAIELWISNLSAGDYLDGVNFWAARRSLPSAPTTTCHYKSPNFERGCEDAKARFAQSDIRRRNEPDFKRGWNSL